MGITLELTKEAFRRTDGNDVDGFVELQAPDCVWETPDGTLEGRAAVREYFAAWHEGFADSRHEILRSYEPDESTVVVVGRFNGTHGGTLPTPAGDVPPTGRRVNVRFCLLVEGDVAARQAKRITLYMDQVALMAQLGLLPEPVQA